MNSSRDGRPGALKLYRRDGSGFCKHYAKIFEDILLSDFLGDKLMENYAIMPSLKEIGFKAKNLKLMGNFSG